MRLRNLMPLFFGSFAVVAWVGCESSPKSAGAAFERPPASVAVVAAVAEDVPVYLDELGKSVAHEVVSIQPQVSGRITEIHFADGADVKKGDLLFSIDSRLYKALLDAAEANLAKTKAVKELASSEFARSKDLVNSKSISRADLDAKRSAVDVAQAQIQQAEAEVSTARLNLEYCSIRSPIEGRTGERLVDLGNIVRPGNDSLLLLQKLNPIDVEFNISESNLTLVQQSMANAPLKVEVRLPDDLREPSVGTLNFLDNSVRETTGTVKLRATLTNQDFRFWPGRLVKVRLILRTIPGAVLIPATAPLSSATGSFVYVVTADSKAESRSVKLGQRHGERIVVEEGVQAGERVIVLGQLGVTPGGQVRAQDLAAPSPTALPVEAKQ